MASINVWAAVLSHAAAPWRASAPCTNSSSISGSSGDGSNFRTSPYRTTWLSCHAAWAIARRSELTAASSWSRLRAWSIDAASPHWQASLTTSAAASIPVAASSR